MKFGVMGTGAVGKALASKLATLGHDVMVGTREPDNESARAWIASSGCDLRLGSFADAAAFGQTLISCTAGITSIDVLRSCSNRDLAGKVLIDVSNPLDLSRGLHSPTLTICNDDSLGETIQRQFPELRVVKALNTCNNQVMVDPGRVPGDHDLFIAGNDAAAKEQVCDLLRSFGWRSVLDLGDITAARGTEGLMLIWLRLLARYGNADFNYKIVRAGQEARS
jgi:predicted dinucleotide-binding enzyme